MKGHTIFLILGLFLISLLDVLNDNANIDKYLLINNKNTSLFDKNYPHPQKQYHLHLIKHWYEVDY
jgi:hypothetical protein